MKKPVSRADHARRALLCFTLFIGVGALFGAVSMLIKPDGSLLQMQTMLPYFQVLPFADTLFQDYTFPGIALLCVNGVPNLIASWLIIRRARGGLALGRALGVTLMLWIAIQFVIFPCNALSSTYFVLGFFQFAVGHAACIFDRQERWAREEQNRAYPHVGEHPERAVVFFSRMGYVRRLAYEEANRTGARVIELSAKERTAGTLGFWWCGRFGMHRWPMPIEPVSEDVFACEHVTLCASVWAFSICAPMRAFLFAANGRLPSVDYILCHYRKGKQAHVLNEMDTIVGAHRKSARSVCVRMGKRVSDVYM